MKKIITSIIVLFTITAITTTISADLYNIDTNILSEYYALDEWYGQDMYYDNHSTSIFFMYKQDEPANEEGFTSADTAQSSEIVIDLPEQPAFGFWFYVDIGNAPNTRDYGGCELTFLDENDEIVWTATTGDIAEQYNYRRYSIGSEFEYYPTPKNAAKIKIKLRGNVVDDNNMVDVYFRNISLMFSNTIELANTDSEILPVFQSSDDLTTVQIGENEVQRWLWIGLVFCVAMIFFVVKVVRDRIREKAKKF